MAKLDMAYIANGFIQNQINKIFHYVIKRDGFKLDHHLVSCVLELMETPTRRAYWKMSTMHFEETKKSSKIGNFDLLRIFFHKNCGR